MRDSTNFPPHKDPPFYKIILLSLIGHTIILFIAFGLPFFTFKEEKTLLPTIKVDLVGLPELRPLDTKPVLKEEPKEIATKTKEEVIIEPKNEIKNFKKEKQKKGEDERLKRVVEKEELSDAISKIAKLKREESNVESSLNKGNIKSTEEHDSDPYKLYLNETIYKNWTPPLRRKIGEIPRFQMFINENGWVLRFIMVKSSGNIEYDKAAEHAIKKSSPFSLPPGRLQRELEKDGVIIDFIPQRE